MPTISVIVPVYNIEEEIPKCLLSILLQTFSDFEVIAVDDGSTDKSRKILDEFSKKYPQIRVFHTKNKGLSAARNFGLSKARGKYISFIDGDDFVDPKFLEQLYTSMVDTDSDISISGYTSFCDEKTYDFVPKQMVLSGEDAAVRLLTKQENIEIVAWNKLYKKSLFKKIKYPEGRILEDNLTTYKLLYEAKKVSYISVPLYNYVVRKNSISSKAKLLERDKICREAALEAKDYFKDNKKLVDASEIAKLLCYFKYLDHSIANKISKKYFRLYTARILRNRKVFLQNPLIDKKRHFYIKILRIAHGKFYYLFRKVIHD